MKVSGGRFKGLLFDLFHTLTGRQTEWTGLPLTHEILGVGRESWNDALFTGSRWRLVGEERDPEKIIAALARQLDPHIEPARIREAVRARRKRFARALRTVPVENLRTLERLRSDGYKLGLVSNADALEVAGWPRSPLCGLFDVELFSCDAGFAKPEREIYLAALARLHLEPGSCLFIGDGGSRELEGAGAVGLVPVLMSGVVAGLWPERLRSSRTAAGYEINSIPQVLDLLTALGEETGGSC